LKRLISLLCMVVVLITAVGPSLAETPVEGKNLDRYIVVFKDAVRASEVANLARSRARASGHSEPRHIYDNGLLGYSAPMTPQRAEALRNDPKVQYVEKVQIFEPLDIYPWHLDRINQRSLPLADFRHLWQSNCQTHNLT
jgi:hypothetical protein